MLSLCNMLAQVFSIVHALVNFPPKSTQRTNICPYRIDDTLSLTLGLAKEPTALQAGIVEQNYFE